MRLSCTLKASLLALLVAVPAFADARAIVAKLRVEGRKYFGLSEEFGRVFMHTVLRRLA